jgi:hypothetical protein
MKGIQKWEQLIVMLATVNLMVGKADNRLKSGNTVT